MRICSAFTKKYEPNILCGNLLTDSIDDIIFRKYHHPRCEKCIQAGLTSGEGYDCKVFPDAYFSLMKENEFLKNSVTREEKTILGEEIKIMHLLREWENSHYSSEKLAELVEEVKKTEISSETVSNIAKEYGRFGSRTEKKIQLILQDIRK